MTRAPGALDGLRVLDMSTLLAAPQVAAVLGDFGADVIKLEPPGGDPLRLIGARRKGHSLMWALANRNKRGITLDIGDERGRAVLDELLARVDVVIENAPPSTLARWRCTYDDLHERNPALVVVSVSGYGRSGPYKDRPGAGTLAEAYAGLTHMTGEADGPPMLPSIPLGDTITAMAGVIGALVACWHRDVRGGEGQHVDVSMYEPILQVLAGTIVAYEPGTPSPSRTGSRVPNGVPRNVYRTADDQWVVVSGTTDAQVARLLPLLGLDDDDGRARFGSSPARLASGDELDALVAEWVRARDRAEVIDTLLAARIPVAPVNDAAALLADPHLAERQDLLTLEDADIGPVTVVAPVPVLEGTPGTVRTTGPRLGAHNDEIYRDWLGLDDTTLKALAAEGVV